MPEDGQLGTAPDGTPVKWVAALGRAVPVTSAQAMAKAAPVKYPAADQKRVTDMMATRDQARNLAGLINDFAVRNDRTKTGGMLGLPGAPSVVQALGTKGSDELGVMDSDSLQAATMLRAPGMRLTQMEFQKFLGGTPSVKKDINANRPFQARYNDAATNAGAQAAFYDHYIRRRGSLEGADDAWSDFSRKHFDAGTGAFLPNGPREQADRAQANTALKARSSKARNAPVVLSIEPGS